MRQSMKPLKTFVPSSKKDFFQSILTSTKSKKKPSKINLQKKKSTKGKKKTKNQKRKKKINNQKKKKRRSLNITSSRNPNNNKTKNQRFMKRNKKWWNLKSKSRLRN